MTKGKNKPLEQPHSVVFYIIEGEKTSYMRRSFVISIILCLSALITLITHTAINTPLKLLIPAVMVSISFFIEFIYKKYFGRIIKSSVDK